uniref:Ubiquinone biosynthesis O-methyltransferase, mitochondrial n=1 Tax=Ananas comosus var. bracteatus TaxID=296719 RepID=A0A6V7QGS8_ANACO|nr:unnamed protein product [Ananas comosus var. bracteatus]
MALRSLRLPRDLCKTLRLLHRTPLQNPNPYSPSPSIASAYPSLLQWRFRSDAAPQIPIKESGEEGKGGSGSKSFASSLNPAEVAKFAAIAETWWDSEGPFKPLHLLNPSRISFIRSTLCRHFRRDPYSARPLEGLKIIDVGCGGGILSEPLARLGAAVTGIDAVEKNIKIARIHADLVRLNKQFDATIALEVIEHVADPSDFCRSLGALTAPGGATVISTINRTLRAYATAIVTAEHILNWLPKGTHEWSKFLTPEELVMILRRASFSVEEMAGFFYNPLTGEWSLSDDISVNYIAFGVKQAS